MKLLHHGTQNRMRGSGEQERNTTYTVSSVTGRRTVSKSVYSSTSDANTSPFVARPTDPWRRLCAKVGTSAAKGAGKDTHTA